eukprot:gb/GEZN01021549.1/.p1 GENE.gb/GEZN01021549.1/~~gb/GEZN01021549.1/.p1  ORF type:complete len:148 (+),score=30.57 gb/GEZN01021549.1/:29-445(+)
MEQILASVGNRVLRSMGIGLAQAEVEQDEEEDEEEDDDGFHVAEEQLGPADDLSDDEVPDTENYIICRCMRMKALVGKDYGTWRFTWKQGVMHIAGKDYVFRRAAGILIFAPPNPEEVDDMDLVPEAILKGGAPGQRR